MPGFYDELCNIFIRPTRQAYSEYDLGISGTIQVLHSSKIKQLDKILALILFQDTRLKSVSIKIYKALGTFVCCIYIVLTDQGLSVREYNIQLYVTGLHFCCFDFAGCGNSAGEYVSLGYNQRRDTLTLIDKIYSQYTINNFFVWGRSMGAVAAIKLCSLIELSKRQNKHSYINMMGVILDSPFCSLSRLAVEVAQKHINIPEILLKAVFMMIKSTIESKADFLVEDLDILNDVSVIKCPTLLIASKDDNLIDWHHSQEIYKELRVENKRIEYISGEHYQSRSKKVINCIYNFIDQSIFKRIAPHQNNTIYEEIMKTSLDRQSKSLRREQIGAELSEMSKFNRNIGSLNKNSNSSTNIFKNISQKFESHLIDAKKYQIGVTIVTQKKDERIKIDTFFSQKKIKQAQQIQKTLDIKNLRCKNKLRNKSKPTVTFQVLEPFSSQPNSKKEFQRAMEMINETSEQCQIKNTEVNHKNIINDKLKKKCKQRLSSAKLLAGLLL